METIELNSLQKIGEGRTASIYAIGSDKVLKLYQPFMSETPVRYEYNATASAFQIGLPVPQPFEFVRIGECFGVTYTPIFGISLLDKLQQHPGQVFSIAKEMAVLHTTINRANAPADIPTQKECILRNLDRISDLSAAQKEKVRKTLSVLPDEHWLCHGDFHPGNIMLTDAGPMVIDWMSGCSGSPAGDLVRSLLIMSTSSIPTNTPVITQIAMNLFRNLLVNAYKKQYLSRLPVSTALLRQWELPVLAARLMEVEAYPLEKERILCRIEKLL